MKSRFCILMFFALFLAHMPASMAQGLGGKLYVLNYNFKFMSTFGYETFKSVEKPDFPNWLRMNKTHQFELEYCITRANVIGGSFYFNRTSDGPGEGTSRLYIFGKGMGFFYKRFRPKNGSIAPIGHYYKVQATRNFYRAEEIFNRENFGRAGTFDLRIGTGRQSVLFRTLLLNIGMEATIPLPIGQSSNTKGIYRGFERDVYSRMNILNSISLTVGISYAAF